MDPLIVAGGLIVLLFSVIFHEVMHGLAALRFGDRTAKNAGRLTLNPLPHIDPIGTILVPFTLLILPMILGGFGGFVFGWAKPVPVNPLNFSNLRRGELVVSSAGILGNVFLALVAGILIKVLTLFGAPIALIYILDFGVVINLSLAVFNLLPIPPLDGSKIVMSLLPYQQAKTYAQLEQYGPILLMMLLIFPSARVFLHSIIDGGVTLLRLLMGI